MFLNNIMSNFGGFIKKIISPKEKYDILTGLFDKNFGSTSDAENYIDKIFKKANDVFNSFNGITEPPKKPEKLSGDLKKQRVKNQNKAYNIIKDVLSKKSIAGSCIPSIINYQGKQVDRAIQNILAPNLSKMSVDEMQAFNDKFINMTSDQKRNYFVGNLNEMNDFINDLSSAITDEEFLKVVDGKAHLLFAIGELQYTNDGYSKELQELFGFKLTDKEKKTWQKISTAGVDLASTMNRLGTIADPYYAIFKDSKALHGITEWANTNEDTIDTLLENGEHEDIKILTTITAAPSNEKQITEFNLLTGKDIGLIYNYVEAQNFNNEQFSKGRLKTNINILVDKLDVRDLHIRNSNDEEITTIDEEGNVVLDAAIDDLYNNKPVYIYNGDNFVQLVKKETEYDNLSKPQQVNNIDFEHKASTEIKEYLNDIKDNLTKGQPWYMKIREFFFPSNYSKIISSIDKMLGKDLNDPKVVRDGMENVYNLAEEYIKAKDSDGKEKTDLTNTREKQALAVFNSFKKQISSYDFIKNIENSSSVREADDGELVIEGLPDQEVKQIPLDDNLFEDVSKNENEIELVDDSQQNKKELDDIVR